MNRIILIGNGFDLAHGLKTSYNDFIDDYWEQKTDKFEKAYKGNKFVHTNHYGNNPQYGYHDEDIIINNSDHGNHDYHGHYSGRVRETLNKSR